MSSKKWNIMFFIIIIVCVGIVLAMNLLVDPFKAFNSSIYDWDSYAFTLNPRVAKVSYFEETKEVYDGYVIGPSGTSSIPVKKLNEEDQANYYNAFVYGADMLNNTLMTQYLIEQGTAKHIIISVSPKSASEYGIESDPITYGLHYKFGERSRLQYTLDYAFVNPRYAFDKMVKMSNDSFVQATHDVFDITTGSYDKSLRDIEKIGDLDQYLGNYEFFLNYRELHQELDATDLFVQDIESIKQLCQEKDIDLEILLFPLYGGYADYYDEDEVAVLYNKLAEVTDFWDFSLSGISKDPRFFYDASHFRNSVGDMIIEKMRGKTSLYMPDDFGIYVTKDNVDEAIERYSNDYTFDPIIGVDDEAYTKELTVINYHHFDDDPQTEATMTIRLFEEHMRTLKEAGYETVHLQQLVDYVEKGIELPEKPIVITMDDGYLSNYEQAFEVMKELDIKTTLFAIGSSIGKDHYKDTDYEIIEHYDFEQAKEMIDSGLVEIQSHSYDLHQYGPYESNTDDLRPNMLMRDDESEENYIQVMADDLDKMSEIFENQLGIDVFALAYPHGDYDKKSEIITSQHGIKVSLTTEIGNNILIKGLPQSLRQLRRYTPSNDMTGEELLEMITYK